jgi:hypothetical protein
MQFPSTNISEQVFPIDEEFNSLKISELQHSGFLHLNHTQKMLGEFMSFTVYKVYDLIILIPSFIRCLWEDLQKYYYLCVARMAGLEAALVKPSKVNMIWSYFVMPIDFFSAVS